ncbi:MAG: hypothetical protein WD448_04930, partial [Woeseia sp.]
MSSLVRLAEADAFQPALGLERREALWGLKALRDEPLPLFAAASTREQAVVPEVDEPAAVSLKAMTAGRNVVEDCGHVGLTLREHPVAFLRADLTRQKVVTCAEAGAMRDGRRFKVAGLVLVRQKPGSAKGVMFITIEDETGVANLVVWPTLFEKQRRVVLAARHADDRRPRPARRRGRPYHRQQAARFVGRADQRRRPRRCVSAAARETRRVPSCCSQSGSARS